MILDGHIHIGNGPVNKEDFARELDDAGIDGGIILSIRPNSFIKKGTHHTVGERLDNLFSWAEAHENLYPFFWIDPTEDDALEQVDTAVSYGVSGFKVICNHFYPGDGKAIKIYQAIANKNKPILFHSGILWDGADSSRYNRPAEFECLFNIEGLRFALAHVSWPWCDENIAVYGKFLNAYSSRPDFSAEMFIDITPGTPPIYREEVLTKLHTVGYDIQNNIQFGSDSSVNDYNGKWVRQWIDRDNSIYQKLALSSDIIENLYSGNLKRFLGITSGEVKKRKLLSGE